MDCSCRLGSICRTWLKHLDSDVLLMVDASDEHVTVKRVRSFKFEFSENLAEITNLLSFLISVEFFKLKLLRDVFLICLQSGNKRRRHIKYHRKPCHDS